MDDLENTLATMLAKPEPPPQAEMRSRNRLESRIRGRSRRRAGRLVPLIALGAAAVLTAVAMTADVAAPAGPPAVAAAPVQLTSARDILLVAAENAADDPHGSGTYWHVRQEHDAGHLLGESWTTRDGRRWSRGMPGRAEGVVRERSASFWLGSANPEVGFADLESLPTDPEALKRRVVESQTAEDAIGELDLAVLPLVSLIAELPAPAEVRSAAFKALATLPGVQRLGAVEGGEELMIPDRDRRIRLVVEPGTSRVIRTNLIPTADGGLLGANDGWIKLTAGWTDELPR